MKLEKRIKQTVKNLIEKQIKIEKEIDFEFREENDSSNCSFEVYSR